MKTKSHWLLVISFLGVAIVASIGWAHDKKLIVHEWGTFTSLQGSDGVPLRWNPLESSRLPNFVYNWSHAGLGRYPSGLLSLGLKSALVTLQRMETPVIYFYADKEQTVDLTVRFPKGGITEWYPQAPQIGPSEVHPGSLITSLDSGLHHCGVSPNFTLESWFDGKSVKQSLIHWPDLKILPAANRLETPHLLTDSSGSHYFAARETDSAYVQTPSFSPTNSALECEKFLFYRGAGNFSTPLNVSMRAEATVSLENCGHQGLSHLFLLGVKGNAGAFVCLDELKPGQRKDLPLDLEHQTLPLPVVRKEFREKMEQALRSEGLFPREAAAMVSTWDDSWIREQGVRVLYLLPRAWTDEILPMTINPTPQKLVRVMVGRAELITPAMEQQLTLELTQARKGEPQANQELMATARNLGRFAKPAFDEAISRTGARPEERDRLLALLYDIRNP